MITEIMDNTIMTRSNALGGIMRKSNVLAQSSLV